MFTFLRFLFLGTFSILYCSEYPFNVGETLNYSVSFSNVKAGKGSLKIIQEDDSTFHIRFQAKTNKLTSFIYPIDDIIDIWLDKTTLTPVILKEDISEGNYKRKRIIRFFQNEGNLVINNKDTVKFKPNAHSPYSLFYFFRDSQLNNYQGKTMGLFQGKTIDLIKINIQKNVTLNSKLGDYFCTKVTPLRANNQKFKNDSMMEIWYSEDQKRYPIQIWLKMKYGGLMLKLEEVIN